MIYIHSKNYNLTSKYGTFVYHTITYIYIYIAKIDGLELVKRQFFQRFLAVVFFKGILLIHHQVVNSTDLRDVKYIFKLDEVILDLSSTRLF